MFSESDYYTALESLLDNGWTPKKLAAVAIENGLHNSDDMDRVAAWIRACMNPRRPDQLFKPYQLLKLMERTGNHGPLLFMCDVLGREVEHQPGDSRPWRPKPPPKQVSNLVQGRFRK